MHRTILLGGIFVLALVLIGSVPYDSAEEQVMLLDPLDDPDALVCCTFNHTGTTRTCATIGSQGCDACYSLCEDNGL